MNRIRRLTWTVLTWDTGKWIVALAASSPPAAFLKYALAAPWWLTNATGFVVFWIILFNLPSPATAQGRLDRLDSGRPS